MSVVTKESNPELYNALFPKDEIKEILHEMKIGIETGRDIYNVRVDGLCYNWFKLKKLFDYITNLQEKYEEADNDRHKLFEQKEKAVEYIENNWITYEDSKQFNEFDEELSVFINEIRILLNILNGE